MSASMLKLIAMSLMLIDHVTAFILYKIPLFTHAFLSIAGKDISLYYILRLMGRISFPIYCFLIVEGFIHTHDRVKYGIRLLSFAVISELPWNFVHSGGMLYSSQNVMFTLLLGYLALSAVEHYKDRLRYQLICLLAIFAVCSFSKVDYGARGLGLIMIIYLLKDKPIAQAVTGSCILNTGWAAGFAFVPINLYNGKRGFMSGRIAKYSAYLFYPIHLAAIGVLRHYVLA